MKLKRAVIFLSLCLLLSVSFVSKSFAVVFNVDIDQDTDVISSTQFPGANQSNQGVNPEIEPISANDGFGTRHVVYLGFDLFSNNSLEQAILGGDSIDKYILHAFNVRNFAQADAVVGDVITSLHYVNNDNWDEGPHLNYTVINSSDPLDGMTFDNQVGFSEFLGAESEDAANIWYDWEFLPGDFALGGVSDDPNYVSLAMVPNELNKTSSWFLVSSFASKENTSNPHPYLEVFTTPIPEPSSILLLGLGLLGLTFPRLRRFRSDYQDQHSFLRVTPPEPN